KRQKHFFASTFGKLSQPLGVDFTIVGEIEGDAPAAQKEGRQAHHPRQLLRSTSLLCRGKGAAAATHRGSDFLLGRHGPRKPWVPLTLRYGGRDGLSNGPCNGETALGIEEPRSCRCRCGLEPGGSRGRPARASGFPTCGYAQQPLLRAPSSAN